MSIRMLAMDVDGTLTDGCIYMGDRGEMMKAFHVQDGYAIAHLLPERGIIPVIITGRASEIVLRRAEELKIRELHQCVGDKLVRLKEVAESYGVKAEEIAYIGDDLNDLACMEFCGVSGCPGDAVPAVREKVSHVCGRSGGRGAVREFVDWLITER